MKFKDLENYTWFRFYRSGRMQKVSPTGYLDPENTMCGEIQVDPDVSVYTDSLTPAEASAFQ